MSTKVSARCPKCKSNSFTLYERLEVANSFRVEHGEARPMHYAEEMPSQIGFTARCDCGHDWSPRYSTATKILDAEAIARER